MNRLLNENLLEASSIVANCAMNRERGVVGGNSYTKELAFNPLKFLESLLKEEAQVSWLDLCCGSGKALIEAATFFKQKNLTHRIQIIGIDLVSFFARHDANLQSLKLIECSISQWQAAQEFDLITCVHGLHYR